jgi:hypothetical protein
VSSPRRASFLFRLGLLLVIGLCAYLWRGGFGLFAFERKVVFHLPVSQQQLSSIDLQVWQNEQLVSRGQRRTADQELTLQALLKRGSARALVTAVEQGQTRSWSKTFDAADSETVVVTWP